MGTDEALAFGAGQLETAIASRDPLNENPSGRPQELLVSLWTLMTSRVREPLDQPGSCGLCPTAVPQLPVAAALCLALLLHPAGAAAVKGEEPPAGSSQPTSAGPPCSEPEPAALKPPVGKARTHPPQQTGPLGQGLGASHRPEISGSTERREGLKNKGSERTDVINYLWRSQAEISMISLLAPTSGSESTN